MIVFVCVVLVVLFALAIDSAFVSWRYALDDRPQRVDVPTADGWTVTAWFRPAVNRRFGVPVVLCHGLANTHAFMEFRGSQNLAKFLSLAGFDCWSVDLRGAGDTRPPHEGPWDVSFDDHVRYDLPALVDAVCARSGSTQVAWVGHSLGGVVALAAASTPLKARFAALVTIGSPIFFAFPRLLTFVMRVACLLSPWGRFDSTLPRYLAPFAGWFPPPPIAHATANLRNVAPVTQRYLLANVFAPMWKGVLGQLETWARGDVFTSLDGLDYRRGVAAIDFPVLVVGGTRDLLAPPEASRRYFELLTTPTKELALFDDYGHGDLVIGDAAPALVYPRLLAFLTSAVGREVASRAE